MFNKIYNSKISSFTFASFLISLSSIFSGILGLLRDRLLAGKFGAGETLDIYFSAFRIPDFLYGIFIAGALGAFFLPLFSREYQKGKENAFWFANNILNFTLLFLVLSSLLLFFLAPYFIQFVTPGLNKIQRQDTLLLMRIMFLSPILLGVSSIFSAVLQYFNKFFVYSLAPIFYNLGVISGILFFYPIFGISGLAFGVVLGAFLHFLIQLPAAKACGYNFQFSFNFKEILQKNIINLSFPPSLKAGFFHLNLIFITSIASTLLPGSISIFNLSNNLQGLIIGAVSVPIAISFFPVLSKAIQDKEEFQKNFSLGIRLILFLIIPLIFLIFLLRAHIVRVVLGTGEFDWQDTRLTAASLGIFSFGILAGSLIPFLGKTFFSLKDTKTPAKIRILSFFANIILSLIFVQLFSFSNFFSKTAKDFLKLQDIKNIQVLAFPLALSISNSLEFLFLFSLFFKRFKILKIKEILNSFKKDLILAFLMGIFVYSSLRLLNFFFPLSTFFGVFMQAAISAISGILIYLIGFILISPKEIEEFKRDFKRRWNI